MFFDNAKYIENERFIQKVVTRRRIAIDAARLKVDREMADDMGMTVEELRKKIADASTENRNILLDAAVKLMEAGMTVCEVAHELGLPESRIRTFKIMGESGLRYGPPKD